MTRSRSFTDQEQRTWAPLTAVLELLPARIDSQLQRDADLTHFDYATLSMLSRTPDRRMSMSQLADGVNASLSRLSHAVSRLERRELVAREPSATDARITDVVLTAAGRLKVIAATPAHVANVREAVLDALDDEQLAQLHGITMAVLARLDPDQRLLASRMG